MLEKIEVLCSLFSSVAFEVEGAHANTIARDIAKSVMKDKRFQSYLALGGPAWLHQRITAEVSRLIHLSFKILFLSFLCFGAALGVTLLSL